MDITSPIITLTGGDNVDWITGIQKAIDYMENNLLDELDYDEIAKQAYVSSFHFQRIFHILSGFTLGEYIRNRRLSLAAVDLQSDGCKVIDVAMKYGYSTPESFARAYERFHGILPSASKGAVVKSFSPLHIKVLLEGGSFMDYRVEVKESFKLLAKAEEQFMGEVKIPKFWKQTEQNGTLAELKKYSSHEDKLIIGFADGTSYTGKSYLYYIGTPFTGTVIPDGFIIKDIPEREWVIFRCINLSEETTNEVAFKKIFSEFFPTSEYEPSMEYQLEVWPDDGTHHPDEVAEIWISAKKKQNKDK